MHLCQYLPGHDPGIIYADAVHITVRSGKINIFKDAFCRLHRTQALIRRNAVPVQHNDLSRLHIPDIFGAHSIQGTGLACQDITVITPSDDQRPEPKGIPGTDKLSGAGDHK